MMDITSIEVPRLVKKPGAFKRVENHTELAAARADGWVLRLPPATGIVLTDAPAEIAKVPVSAAQEGAGEVLDAQAEDAAPETAEDSGGSVDEGKRKAGRPKKG